MPGHADRRREERHGAREHVRGRDEGGFAQDFDRQRRLGADEETELRSVDGSPGPVIFVVAAPGARIPLGAIAWLVTVPGLLFFAALGSGGYLGAWYGGLAGPAAWAPQASPAADNAAALLAARNAALGSLTALLLGLAGSVVGGWLGTGERMTLNFSKLPHRQHGRAWGGTR